MFSTLLEVAGFAAIIAATYLLGGLIAGLYTAGGVLLLAGYALDDTSAVLSLNRAVWPFRRALRRARSVRVWRREPAKAG